MLKPATRLGLRSRRRTPVTVMLAAVLVSAAVLGPSVPAAQSRNVHLNPVIAKLAEGKTVYGLITSDLSLANARETAQAPVDFVYVDMEHNPLDFPALNMFLLGMTDRGASSGKGTCSPMSRCLRGFRPKPTSRSGS